MTRNYPYKYLTIELRSPNYSLALGYYLPVFFVLTAVPSYW